ncbi:MAG: hypothetical protein JXB38_20725 [Anaerolineales bacterium]|nr:hypothetical protein [Anaerolineales bacterium]
MKLYSYTVKFDSGFAPNPFGKFCTLATCKPKIRLYAQEGDWVMGSGSVATVGGDRLVYAMEITKVLSLQDYAKNPNFKYKKPIMNGSWKERCGDNVYEKVDGEWTQLPSPFHGSAHLEKDTGGQNVLISENFYYFGKEAIEIPKQFQKLIFKRGYKKEFDDDLVQEFIDWLKTKYRKGIHGDPIDREGECDCEEPMTNSSKDSGCAPC